MCVHTRSRNQRSWLTTTALPAKSICMARIAINHTHTTTTTTTAARVTHHTSEFSKLRSTSTSRSFVGSSSMSTFGPSTSQHHHQHRPTHTSHSTLDHLSQVHAVALAAAQLADELLLRVAFEVELRRHTPLRVHSHAESRAHNHRTYRSDVVSRVDAITADLDLGLTFADLRSTTITSSDDTTLTRHRRNATLALTSSNTVLLASSDSRDCSTYPRSTVSPMRTAPAHPNDQCRHTYNTRDKHAHTTHTCSVRTRICFVLASQYSQQRRFALTHTHARTHARTHNEWSPHSKCVPEPLGPMMPSTWPALSSNERSLNSDYNKHVVTRDVSQRSRRALAP
jgi:hypothetical protein